MGNSLRRPALRVVSYNVKRWNDLEAVVETLAAKKADVICLNECCSQTSPDALARVAAECGMAHTHFFGHVNSGRYGNAILTRGASKLAAEWHLAGGSTIKARGKDHRLVRGAVAVACDVPGGALHVCCTHLDHIAEVERVTQATDLVARLQELGAARCLVVGDLNALKREESDWPRLEALHAENGWAAPVDSALEGNALRTFLDAGFVDVSEGAGPTSPAIDPVRRIDYVLAARSLNAAATAQTDRSATGSDHLPLIVDVRLELVC